MKCKFSVSSIWFKDQQNHHSRFPYMKSLDKQQFWNHGWWRDNHHHCGNIFIGPMLSDLWVLVSLTNSLSERCSWNLTDVTLADEDTKSKPTDNAKRAIQGNEAMQVLQTGAIWRPNLQLMHVVPSGGLIFNYIIIQIYLKR